MTIFNNIPINTYICAIYALHTSGECNNLHAPFLPLLKMGERIWMWCWRGRIIFRDITALIIATHWWWKLVWWRVLRQGSHLDNGGKDGPLFPMGLKLLWQRVESGETLLCNGFCEWAGSTVACARWDCSRVRGRVRAVVAVGNRECDLKRLHILFWRRWWGIMNIRLHRNRWSWW